MSGNKYKKTISNLLAKADIQIEGPRSWDIQIFNDDFYKRVLSKGTLGLGESYMDGWWDCKELDQFFYKALQAELEKNIKMGWVGLKAYLTANFFNLQTYKRSKQVAEQHYDLSTKLYMSFLDPYSQYSCGYFKNTSDLNIAQEQKLRLICDKLKLKKEDRVLDIGCGWGGFAKYASEHYGCNVTGINISKEQAAFAREFTKGFQVTIEETDYRNLTGKYDKILICGMIEHVGNKNYRKIFEIVEKCLSDNGLFLLHTIGNNETTPGTDPWIDKYIFPNCKLPSLRQLTNAFEGLFILEDLHNFGAYYDLTLTAWFKNFDKNWPSIKQDFDEKFYRMWKYYLLSCAGQFRARQVQLWQFVFSKKGLEGVYNSIR